MNASCHGKDDLGPRFKEAAEARAKAYKCRLGVYRCEACHGFHVATLGGGKGGVRWEGTVIYATRRGVKRRVNENN